MASDLDRRCNDLEHYLRARIERRRHWLARIRVNGRGRSNASNARLDRIIEDMEAAIVDLYYAQNAHQAYDAALEEASQDPTGQDVDAFYEAYGEGD